MGLDYLNKKVWHPGSLKNIQKVWQVEQEELALKKKYKQKLKKLQQQQHAQQMKRIQVEAGLIPKSHLERMDWMYDWGNKIHQNEKNKEEYLLGNKQANGKKENKHVFQEEATNKKCEDFSLLHEDPMFQIQRQQMKLRSQIMSNPIQMKSIIKDVEENYFIGEKQENLLKKHKKHKKDKKHKSQKKSKKHKSRQHSSDEQSRSRSRNKNKDRLQKSRQNQSSSSRSRSSSQQKTSKSSNQSKVYQQYLKQKFGGILKQDEDGNLKPDYNRFRPKYKTQVQLDEQERRRRLDQMRQNSRRLHELRNSRSDHQDKSQRKHEYEEGLGSLKKDMLNQAKPNRNLQKYKQDSD